MGKNIVRLTESDIRRIVKQSVRSIMNESVEMTSDEAWENYRLAKESGDPQEITIALRELENTLRREKKLIKYNVKGGGEAWATPGSQFVGKWADDGEGTRTYTVDPRFRRVDY